MNSPTQGCSRVPTANNTACSPSLLLGVSSIELGSRTLNSHRNAAAHGGSALRHLLLVLSCAIAITIVGGFAASCGDSPKPAETKSEPAPATAVPAKPAVPDDIQAGAQALLGTETTVLVYGDLAKNGKQQFLAANVVPKTSKNNNIPGTIITRAVIAQNDAGQWKEIFRCDEHLKNAKGFLGYSAIRRRRMAHRVRARSGKGTRTLPDTAQRRGRSSPLTADRRALQPADEALPDSRSHLRTFLARTADDGRHTEIGIALTAAIGIDETS